MPEQAEDQMVDFFISYNTNDRQWAEWVAWQLEQGGYTTIIQAWDFAPGSNFVLEMQDAASRAKRTISILTQNYLDAEFTQPEWAAAFVQDPTGTQRKLIPVRVDACQPNGLLAPIVYLDLVGLDPETAKQTLLNDIQEGRRKPDSPPPFPGASSVQSALPRAIATMNTSELWRIERVVEISSGKSLTRMLDGAKLVLHIVPLVTNRTEFSNEVLKTTAPSLKPLYTTGWDYGFNKHGYSTWAQWPRSELPHSYTQLFRSGEIEAVDSGLLMTRDGKTIIPSVDLEREIMSSTKRYLRVLRDIGVPLPVSVSISLTNVKGYSMGYGFRAFGKLDDETVSLPSVIIHNWDDDIPSTFRPSFDRLWNNFEMEGSPSYGADGVWRPPVF